MSQEKEVGLQIIVSSSSASAVPDCYGQKSATLEGKAFNCQPPLWLGAVGSDVQHVGKVAETSFLITGWLDLTLKRKFTAETV